ncbi:MAG: thioesterase family protein [Pseudomonadota bacterium]
MSRGTEQPGAPLVCPPQKVEPAWIDYNGHMNMAYYHVVFDRALDHVYDLLGVGADYTARGAGACFTLEVHVTYLAELVLNDPVRVEFQLLDQDDKRLHFFERMYHAERGDLAATSEQIALNVALPDRRAAPFPEPALDRIRALMSAHRTLPLPEQMGRTIGIRRRR